MSRSIVYATFSTWVTPTIHVEKGEVWDADDPVVRSHPDWFTSSPAEFVRRSGMETATADNKHRADTRVSTPTPPVVEETTSAPGEKRTAVPRVADK